MVAGLLRNKATNQENSKITFKSDVTLENVGVLTTTANVSVVFEGNVLIKGTTNTITAGTKINFKNGTKVTIAEGASAVLSGNFGTATTYANVENKGIVNIASAVAVAKIDNKGTLNVTTADAYTLTGNITNAVNGTVNLKKGGAGALTLDGDVNNKGNFNVEADVTATVDGYLVNFKDANVNNLGALTVGNGDDEVMVNAGTITNGSTTNSKASIVASQTSSDPGTKPEGENKGTIENYGAVTVKTNTGTINMKTFMAKATVGAAHATEFGDIYNDAGGVVNGMTNNQHVWKTITGNNLVYPAATPSNYNAVVYEDAVITVTAAAGTKSTADALAAVEFKGTSKLTVTGASGAYFTLPKKVDVTGSFTLIGVKSGSYTADVVGYDAVVFVDEGAVMNLQGIESGLTVDGDTDHNLTIKYKGTVNTNVVLGSNVTKTKVGNGTFVSAN